MLDKPVCDHWLDRTSRFCFTLSILIRNWLAQLRHPVKGREVGPLKNVVKSVTAVGSSEHIVQTGLGSADGIRLPLMGRDGVFIGRPVSREDLSFTHSIFVQCFLPLRPLAVQDNQHWEVRHGRASLSIEAGRLADPRLTGRWEAREVPAGPKARLLFAYINDFAIRHRTPVIDLGKSLRRFMESNRVPIGGPNGREIGRQLKNIASARIVLGIWDDARVSTRQSRVAAGIDFWRDGSSGQSTFWEPEMQLAPEYFEELRKHRVPIYFPGLVKLQANPRAMDVFCWLVYRMRSVAFPVKIPYAALHPVFGGGIKLLKHFKAEFRKTLMAVHDSYPQARVELDEDHLTLRRSPSLITREI